MLLDYTDLSSKAAAIYIVGSIGEFATVYKNLQLEQNLVLVEFEVSKEHVEPGALEAEVESNLSERSMISDDGS